MAPGESYKEGTFEKSAPPIPVDPSRIVNQMFWGDVGFDGGFRQAFPLDRDFMQLLFTWDPRVNDWTSVTTFVLHYGIDQEDVPSVGRSIFHRPGMESSPIGLDTALVPGDGYVFLVQGQSPNFANGIDPVWRLDITHGKTSLGLGTLVRQLPWPGDQAPVSRASWVLRPPIMVERHDSLQFELVKVSGPEFVDHPWIDVYFNFRWVNPKLDRKAWTNS